MPHAKPVYVSYAEINLSMQKQHNKKRVNKRHQGSSNATNWFRKRFEEFVNDVQRTKHVLGTETLKGNNGQLVILTKTNQMYVRGYLKTFYSSHTSHFLCNIFWLTVNCVRVKGVLDF